MRHITLMAAALLLASCNNATTPTTPDPAPVAASRAGAWTGQMQATACSDGNYGCRLGGVEDVTLRLAPDGTGVAQLTPFEGAQSYSVDLTGSRGSDGGWAGSGTLSVPGRSRVDAQVALSAVGAAGISGTVTYTLDHGLGAQTRSARILSSRAINLERPGPFQGRWAGWVERTSCSGTCDDDTLFGNLVDFEIAIAQTGSALAGTIMRVGPFTAVSNGESFTLSVSHGKADDPECLPPYYGRTCYVEISNMNVTIDKLDRMHGSFSYRAQGYTDTGSPYSSVSGTVRLIGVARWD